MIDYERVSKFISLVLRHKPDAANLSLDKYGYAQVDELVAYLNKKYGGFTVTDLDTIVETDDKQRYSYNNDHTKIRAVQGHSIKVELELIEQQPPELLYHGTAEKYIPSIMEQGLIPKQRQYVHLSNNTFTAHKVGQRHGGRTYICVIASQLMYEHGYKFYVSENGVWLTDKVPTKYLTPCLVDSGNEAKDLAVQLGEYDKYFEYHACTEGQS